MNNNNKSGGITFLGLLQVAFIVLKVIGQIDWSWKMVFIPTWISLAIVVVAVLVLILLNK